jgi:hypothetical protein
LEDHPVLTLLLVAERALSGSGIVSIVDVL